MKKIIYIIVLSITVLVEMKAQTRIVNVNSGESFVDAPSGTYIKDINNTFTPYLGTWKYQNGNEILIIKFEKVTKHYYPEYNNYKDFIKGNYSYTNSGGTSYITNTIVSNFNNNDPNANSFYSGGPSADGFYRTSPSVEILDCSFKDQLHQKSADALFSFVAGTTTQLQIKLIGHSRGYIFPEVVPPSGFSIPHNVILTKQP